MDAWVTLLCQSLSWIRRSLCSALDHTFLCWSQTRNGLNSTLKAKMIITLCFPPQVGSSFRRAVLHGSRETSQRWRRHYSKTNVVNLHWSQNSLQKAQMSMTCITARPRSTSPLTWVVSPCSSISSRSVPRSTTSPAAKEPRSCTPSNHDTPTWP